MTDASIHILHVTTFCVGFMLLLLSTTVATFCLHARRNEESATQRGRLFRAIVACILISLVAVGLAAAAYATSEVCQIEQSY